MLVPFEAYKSLRGGMEYRRHTYVPPGSHRFFAVPLGMSTYFDNNVVPGDTKEIGGASSKRNKMLISRG